MANPPLRGSENRKEGAATTYIFLHQIENPSHVQNVWLFSYGGEMSREFGQAATP